MRHTLEPAFILHRRPYRDSSLLLDAISRSHGRIVLIARGAQRGKRSRLAGILQVFQPLLLSWSGRGEILSLNHAEEAGPPYLIPAPRSLSALYANELLLRLLARHDAFPEVFRNYHHLLAMLSGDDNEEPYLRYFEKQLLEQLGYGMLLHLEAQTMSPVLAENTYRYDFARGPVEAGANTAEHPGAGFFISGKSLLALHHNLLSEQDALQECKRLMRTALGLLLEDKPLKTRQLAIAYKRYSRHTNKADA